MRILAHQLSGKDLQTGDLFSMADQYYWDNYDLSSIGQRVYIRTSAPCPPDQLETVVYRIAISR